MKIFTILFLLISAGAIGQPSKIAHFSVWKPKRNQADLFEKGYKEHLRWHSASGDTWNWYGWFIISGPRDGYFIDATFGHKWSDFDVPKDPAGDGADNKLHTEPFADFLTGYNVSLLPFSDEPAKASLQTKLLRMVTIDVNAIEAGIALVKKLKIRYKERNASSPFLAFKMIDGGNIQQIILLIGLDSFADYKKMENLQDDLSDTEANRKIVTAIQSETLIFRRDMSLNIF
jgi:hypothetical protein